MHAPLATPRPLITCNIGMGGRWARGIVGTCVIVGGMVALAGDVHPMTSLAGLGALLGGSFMIFEALFAWCVVKAFTRDAARSEAGSR